MAESSSTTIAPTTMNASTGPTALRVVEYIMFIIIFVISVIGNVLVCLVIYKTPRMRTARNSLIVNLAVADLTVALVCIPFDVVIKVYGSPWPLGVAMCKVVWPSMTLVTTCSAATLTAISYDRYRAVVYPYKPALTRAQTALIISITWLVSLVLVIPYIVALRLIEGECDEMWFSPTARQGYTGLLFVCQYALPVVVIGLAYTRIAVKLREQAFSISQRSKVEAVNACSPLSTLKPTNDRSGEDSALPRSTEMREAFTDRNNSPVLTIAKLDRQKELMRHKRNAKIVRMLTTVFLMYAIWLLPNQIIWMWIEFGSGLDVYKHIDTLLTFSSLSVYISSCVNPFVYAGMNEDFRKGFLKVLKLCSDNNNTEHRVAVPPQNPDDNCV